MKEANYIRIYATQVNQKWQLHLFYISNANVNYIMNAKLFFPIAFNRKMPFPVE